MRFHFYGAETLTLLSQTGLFDIRAYKFSQLSKGIINIHTPYLKPVFPFSFHFFIEKTTKEALKNFWLQLLFNYFNIYF